MNDENQYDLTQFFSVSLDMLCIAGTDGYFKLINPSFQRILGWSEEMLLTHTFLDFIHPEDIEATVNEVEKLKFGAPTLAFYNRYRCVDGSYRHFSWSAFPNQKTGLIYAIARDITDLVESNQKISQLATELKNTNNKLFEQAYTDPLTKLKNRRSFNEEMNYLISLTQRQENVLSLLMIDVDHFKDYNDQFGHPAGDQVLTTLASLLTRTLRGSDVLARYGGEEFIIALPNTSEDKAIELAEKLVTVTREFAWEKRSVTISVGVATENFDKNTQIKKFDYSTSLIENADKALYHSKTNGRNQATHSSQLKKKN
ncbi:sensor domain-containing diguanylate cyclase [Leptospira alstonii]|uniref:diguanylate cyclase n=2 Tax=Leptospira alstonii TaxID=28452 RepID=M6D6E9_9LEPT|nr:sensor domain-containing diguanylate cyclase [Leptospira alstonii]EMJ94130.1 diguanylate cyclase (GGDEF) domain protein [Leptospira alstonii serovar Sichuan str. 79601]EQA79238.1 diguanylate cyclase (GGDEF) domain protein [Leptospira alstonii serovar Pingchang str. 80-412]